MLNMREVERLVQAALDEDIAHGDITTNATVTPNAWAEGVILSRQDGVIAGLPVAATAFRLLSPDILFLPSVTDGGRVSAGETIALLRGPARAILTAERTALNFLGRLSGIATATARFVEAVQGTTTRILDTRKTTPGLRLLEKYAVRLGGGYNHRFGLADGVLIKDNHIALAGGITAAVRAARQTAPHTLRIEVETETLDQVDEALAAGADIILLDNMDTATTAQAVARIAGRAYIEASGTMTLARVGEVARAGVDAISVGALTHSVTTLDVSLELTTLR